MPPKRTLTITFLVTLFLVASAAIGWAIFSRDDGPSQKDRFAVSWMRTWATTGQIMCVLENTNIPELYDSTATFPNFLFGPRMNEAAYAGQVDATNTGIVPTLNLLAASDDWVVVCRLIDFPVALVAPNDSGIESVQDLRGKKVGVPFGGGSHPYILQRMDEHNLTAGGDDGEVELVNLKPPDQALALQRGEIDAVATWEPQTAIVLEAVPSSVIDRDVHVGFLAVRRSYLEKNPEEVTNLLKAYYHANLYVAQNRELTDQWFREVSEIDPDLLSRIETIESNLTAEALEDIDLEVSDEDIDRTQRVADIMFVHDLLPRRVDFESRVDMTYLRQAREELLKDGLVIDGVRVKDQ